LANARISYKFCCDYIFFQGQYGHNFIGDIGRQGWQKRLELNCPAKKNQTLGTLFGLSANYTIKFHKNWVVLEVVFGLLQAASHLSSEKHYE